MPVLKVNTGISTAGSFMQKCCWALNYVLKQYSSLYYELCNEIYLFKALVLYLSDMKKNLWATIFCGDILFLL